MFSKSVMVLFVVALTTVLARAQTVDIGAPPGRLVDVGGRRLHLNCTGQGSPTVVFEAGAGAFSVDWALVQPTVALTNRACSYDRARYAWSDPSPSAEMPAAVVRDLHALLQAANEPPPYVLVGQSMGGIYARIYERRYSTEVAGMVFVDPVHEDDLFAMFEGKPVTLGSLTAEQLLQTLPPGDVTVPTRPPQLGEPFDRLPDSLHKLRVELEKRLIALDTSKPVPHAIAAEGVEGQRAALAELQQAAKTQAQGFGSRPLVVLTRGLESRDNLRRVHLALSRTSTNGRHSVVAGAGHEIQLYQPSIVIQAIQDVLDSIRTKQHLPDR